MFSKFRDWWRAGGGFSLSRRQLLISVGIGVGGGTSLRELRAQQDPAPPYLRPPGARPETEFTNYCVRCNACFHACPTKTLKPAPLEQGLLGWGTPILVAREGGCMQGCNACGKACPTGAIEALPLFKKQRLKMGVAVINPARCLPFSTGTPCTSCVRACPYDAIRWEYPGPVLPWGEQLAVPVVIPEKCTGCGLCETDCPVAGEAAIKVRAEYPRRELAVASAPKRQIEVLNLEN